MSGLASDPFGEASTPWWRSKKQHAPKRYAAVAGAIGSFSGLFLHSGDGLDKPTRLAIVAVLTFVPPFVVEYWWRARHRLRDEQLLIVPK
jgi:hypothetical protein